MGEGPRERASPSPLTPVREPGTQASSLCSQARCLCSHTQWAAGGLGEGEGNPCPWPCPQETSHHPFHQIPGVVEARGRRNCTSGMACRMSCAAASMVEDAGRFRFPAPRREGQGRGARGSRPMPTPKELTAREIRQDLHEGVPHEVTGTPVAVKVGLEGENHHHAVHQAGDGAHPVAAPGPHLGADVVHHRHPVPLGQPGRQEN